MALIPPFFLDAVIAIGILNNNVKQWTATGFLYGSFIKQTGNQNEYRIYLVTNRHVFENQSKMFARFDGASGGDLEFDLPLVDGNQRPIWTSHPNPKIDVAVIAINASLLTERGAKYRYFQSDGHILTKDMCLKNEISEGCGIFLLGFPMGLVGQDQNYVLVRDGVISRIKDCLISKSDHFIASVQTFPGNSGGPLVTKPEIVSIQGTKTYSSASLIGIISSYFTYKDIAVSAQTKQPRIVFEENSGLSVAYPVDCIIDCINKASAEQPAEASPRPTQ